MIRRLRWKFVAINMAIVTLLMAVICSFLYVTTTGGLREDSMSVLRRVVKQEKMHVTVWKREGERESFWSGTPFQHQEVSLPFFTVDVDREGSVTVVDSQFYDMEDQDSLLEIVQAGMDSKRESGLLRSCRLRYLRKSTTDGCRMAFVDVTQELSTTRNLIVNLLLIGLAALVGFFFISLLLARWAVRPVERSWKQQRQFVADASHELKTPLTVVLSNVDMLQSCGEEQEEKRRRWVDNIQASSLQMKELVEEMLTLARSDNMVQRERGRERVNFSDLVLDSVLQFEPVIFEAGKFMEEDVAEDLSVTGDAAKLKRLVDVLLDNAQKYTPAGGQIYVSLAAEGSKRIRLSVRNQGDPIPQEDLERIFERFYRTDKARTTGGFGLGLSIAREIAREHRGRLWAESDPATGNTFCFSMPIARENG
jgi:signal transduction histidine kinase